MSRCDRHLEPVSACTEVPLYIPCSVGKMERKEYQNVKMPRIPGNVIFLISKLARKETTKSVFSSLMRLHMHFANTDADSRHSSVAAPSCVHSPLITTKREKESRIRYRENVIPSLESSAGTGSCKRNVPMFENYRGQATLSALAQPISQSRKM